MSYTVSLFHVVFGTYRRYKVLDPAIKESFIQYVGGIIRNHRSKLICANFMPDHVHLLFNLNAEKSLANVVGAVKQSTSVWLKKEERCPKFKQWSKEYYAVSLSPSHQEAVEQYINNQENHHRGPTFNDELDRLIMRAGLTRYRDSFYE